jgi:hypothetical protein
MKKILMLMVVAVLMFGVSGQAMAAFSGGDLIQVVFSTSGVNEVATDLGSISALTSPSAGVVSYTANNFNLSQLGGTADASNSYVAYFAIMSPINGGSANKNAWFSGTGGTQSVAKTAFGGYDTHYSVTTGQYQVSGGGASQVVLATSNANSFWAQLTTNGASLGGMGGILTNANATAAQSLANLATLGYVTTNLYYYGAIPGTPGAYAGTNVSGMTTYADGHSALNGPTTPIPAAVYLFGSGLMGLVGLRRKMA